MTRLLSEEELILLKDKLPQWIFQNKRIVRKFEFTNFIDAFGFLTQVALIAESMNHHPSWSNTYGQVSIELTTHDLDGLSNKDFVLAQRINTIFDNH